MYNALALLGLGLSCYFLLRLLRPHSLVAGVLVFYCLFTGQVAVGGYLLSAARVLSDLRYWALYGVIAASLSFVLFLLVRPARQRCSCDTAAPPASAISSLRAGVNQLSWFERATLLPLLGTVVVCGLANLALALFTAPTNWDSMTCHLARIAYFLQHNSLAHYDANNYMQTIYQRQGAVLMLYTYLVSGRSESACQLVQYAAYWAAVFSVYGISAAAGGSKKQALFAALVFGLLTECLMQAISTQVDMLLASYVGTLMYFLVAFRLTRQRKYLGYAGLAVGLSIGTKTLAFLILPCILPVALYGLVRAGVARATMLRNLVFLGISASVGTAVLGLPTGYVDNYCRFGDLVGPAEVWDYRAILGQSLPRRAWEGVKSTARCSIEFLSLDGIPPVSAVHRAQMVLRFVPKVVAEQMGMALEADGRPGREFRYDRLPMTNEDFSYWGLLGFALIWVTVILSAVGVVKCPGLRALSLGALLFVVAVSFGLQYDKWLGRYFLSCAVFATPVVGVCVGVQRRVVRSYVAGVTLLGCVSALLAVALRPDRPLVTIRYQSGVWKSVFSRDRIEQLTAHRREYYSPISKYEELVPAGATVAVWLKFNSYEYPLFGEGLTRRIIPLNVHGKGTQPIPTDADYLLYCEGYPFAIADDVHLGADWYLRKLKKDAGRAPLRQCPLETPHLAHGDEASPWPCKGGLHAGRGPAQTEAEP